jgi:multidrug efflux system membrane fusion protein
LAIAVFSNVLTVPQTAVQVGQNGNYVFVIKPDRTAEVRPVKATRTIDGKSVIASGLNEGEEVAVDGQLRLRTACQPQVCISAASHAASVIRYFPQRGAT